MFEILRAENVYFDNKAILLNSNVNKDVKLNRSLAYHNEGSVLHKKKVNLNREHQCHLQLGDSVASSHVLLQKRQLSLLKA